MTNAGMNEITNARAGVNQVVAQLASSGSASDSAGTEAPAVTPAPADETTDGATFVAPAINPDTLSVLSDDDLIAACKSQFKLTDSSYSLFRRDKHLLASIYDEMVSRFRDEHSKGDEREGKPTLKQAFARFVCHHPNTVSAGRDSALFACGGDWKSRRNRLFGRIDAHKRGFLPTNRSPNATEA